MNDQEHAQLINKLKKELYYLKSQRHTWEQKLHNMTINYSSLLLKVNRLEESLRAHAVGLQNVYDEFKNESK